MSRRPRGRFKSFVLGTLHAVLMFAVFGLLGMAAFMWLRNVVGYLPYSDRPGPGWEGWFPLRHVGDILSAGWFYLSWVLFAAPFFLLYGTLIALPFAAMRLSRMPRWFVAILAGPFFAYACQYLVAGFGWYIAIALPPVIASAVFGLVYGAWYLPYRIHFTPKGHAQGKSAAT